LQNIPTLQYKNLGVINYKEAWDYQEKLFAEIIQQKMVLREMPQPSTKPIQSTNHYLLMCEHPNVYTLGKSGHENNLLINDNFLKTIDATYFKINRGGDITFHGPGQLVGYPILNLDDFFTDIHKYLRLLEEVIILTLAEYGIVANRFPQYTGVWIEPGVIGKERKICAMGVRCSRWVTMHGWALNVNTDLSYFNHIVPCGIVDKQVTSIEKELGYKVPLEDVEAKIKKHFTNQFECQLS
jgi:lipoyl(octanoyl) transferase